MIKWFYGAGALLSFVGFVTCLIADEWLASIWAFNALVWSTQLFVKEVFE